MRPHWYEAVALVCALAERLLSSGAARVSVPELNQIVLDASGSVDVTGGAPTSTPVPRLAQVLQALVTASDAPVQLRLLIADATAPVTVYESIRHLIAALAYFERPDRAAVLAALYRRADAAAAGPETKPVTVATLVHPIVPPVDARGPSRRRVGLRQLSIVVACVAVALVAVQGVRSIRTRKIALPSESTLLKSAGGQASRMLRLVDRAAMATLSNVSDHLGLGRLAPADAGRIAPVAVREEVPAPPVRRRPSRRLETRPAAPVQLFALPAVNKSLKGEIDEDGDGHVEAVTGVSSEAPRERPAASGVIYSNDSPGVQPPVALRPEVARESSADVANLRRLELIIDTAGAVESARLIDPPSDVRDAVLLSAAKAMIFRPATKDGTPVRYRKVVLIHVNE